MEYKVQPWAHQLEAIERAKALNCFALFFDAGTGKTGTTINILRHKFNDTKRVLRTIVFAPPVVVSNWKDEWLKHSKIDQRSVVLLTGAGKRRVKIFKENAYKQSDLGVVSTGCIFVTNYESLLMADLYDAFKAWAPEVLVFDESHKLKNPAARRTKLAQALANPRDQRSKAALPRPLAYILSGSPVLNSPLDLFAQFLVMDGGQAFGQNYYAFRARYFRDVNAGMPKDRYFPKWEVMPGSLEAINQKIFEKGMRAEKKDCLDLPPLVKMVHKIEMSPAQAKAYKEMKQHFITYINDKACVATLAITKSLRLAQIASGFIAVETKGEESDVAQILFDDVPKLKALKDLLEDLTVNHKVLVWACWRTNYEQIANVCKDLGVDYVEVFGGMSSAQRDTSIKRFREDPKVRVFIGNQGAAGIGINLIEASYMIFYSRNFSLEQDLQAEARCYRGGSEMHEKITRIDLCSEGTIDELIVDKLQQKIEISAAILKQELERI